MIVTSALVGSAIAETALVSDQSRAVRRDTTWQVPSLGSAMDRHQGRRSPPARLGWPSVTWSARPGPARRTALRRPLNAGVVI